MLDNADPGIDDEADHSILHKEKSNGVMGLLEMQQLSRAPDHGTRMTEHLGERGAHQVNCVFRQDTALFDPQLVEVVVREVLRAAERRNPGSAEAQLRLLAQRAPRAEVQR